MWSWTSWDLCMPWGKKIDISLTFTFVVTGEGFGICLSWSCFLASGCSCCTFSRFQCRSFAISHHSQCKCQYFKRISLYCIRWEKLWFWCGITFFCWWLGSNPSLSSSCTQQWRRSELLLRAVSSFGLWYHFNGRDYIFTLCSTKSLWTYKEGVPLSSYFILYYFPLQIYGSLSSKYFLLQCVQRPYGVVYMAAKKYYFGVGGGTRQFLSMVEKDGEPVRFCSFCFFPLFWYCIWSFYMLTRLRGRG